MKFYEKNDRWNKHSFRREISPEAFRFAYCAQNVEELQERIEALQSIILNMAIKMNDFEILKEISRLCGGYGTEIECEE